MILYFLRHGKAGEYRAGDPDDDARELTDAGVAELRAAAQLWRRLNLRPDLVICSPLPRALQTAELLVEGVRLARRP
ncbi:MAG: histidine phosphatase family protein, partial [Chloroflexota bacterium]|nr:histidine phosphatase family protein [Chloroflexota bacterium]